MIKIILLFLMLAISASAQANSSLASGDKNRTASSPQSPERAEATRLSVLMVRLYNEGKYDEAYREGKRALEIASKALPKDDDLLVLILINLGEVEWKRDHHEETRKLFERALHSYENRFGPEHVRLAGLWDRLALINYYFGRFGETEKLYKKSLAVREKALGPEDPETARSLYLLAEFYQFQGAYENAEPLYKRLLDIRMKVKTSADQLAEVMDRYACLLRKEKRIDEADRMEGRDLRTLGQGDDAERFFSGGIVNGKAVYLAQPPYPAEARAGRVSGQVKVRVLIDEKGNVMRVCALEGRKELMKASEAAAARSKFSATTVNGNAVKVTGVIIYNYVAR